MVAERAMKSMPNEFSQIMLPVLINLGGKQILQQVLTAQVTFAKFPVCIYETSQSFSVGGLQPLSEVLQSHVTVRLGPPLPPLKFTTLGF